jgi:hypothetical protein
VLKILAMLATLMQAVPVLAGIVARTGFAGPRRWVAAWCVIALALDATMSAFTHTNNLWVTYLVGPLMGSAALYAMARWQRDDVAAITIRMTVPLALAVWLVALLRLEDVQSFSLLVDPMYSVLCLGVALFTLGRRGLLEDAPLVGQDWFWICGGFALYYGKAAAASPLGALLVASRPDIVRGALTLMAGTDIVAYLFLLMGILCRPPTPSGVSSSPSPSAWRSWWSPSERPS